MIRRRSVAEPLLRMYRVFALSVTLSRMRRRHFLTLSAATLGGVLVYSLDRKASLLTAQHKPIRLALRFFTETEALIVAAAASRIFPSDESGPGAREAGVAIFIDRQLAGSYGRDRFRYTQPCTKSNRRSSFLSSARTPSKACSVIPFTAETRAWSAGSLWVFRARA